MGFTAPWMAMSRDLYPSISIFTASPLPAQANARATGSPRTQTICSPLSTTGQLGRQLRHFTSTIDSPSLICASIMSKKLAEGIDALVLDVKTGSGAFMKLEEDAALLGELMVDTAKRMGVRAVRSQKAGGGHRRLGARCEDRLRRFHEARRRRRAARRTHGGHCQAHGRARGRARSEEHTSESSH